MEVYVMSNPVEHAFQMQVGNPSIMGGTYDPETDSVNFSVYSKSAAQFASKDPTGKTGVYVCFYDETGTNYLGSARLNPPKSDISENNGVWHGSWARNDIEGLGLKDFSKLTYCLRVQAPYEPDNGHRFNVHKALIDPYAIDLVGVDEFEKARRDDRQELFCYKRSPFNPAENAANANNPELMDTSDSGPYIPKARIRYPQPFSKAPDTRPNIPWSQTVIRETHVKSDTILHPEVPEEHKGKLKGLSYLANYYKKLCTAIELLPVHWFINETSDKVNYWGYNTANFFRVSDRYGCKEDLKQLVQDMHSEGLEVILDVVYNHTAEGNEQGPIFSYKGLDNFEYYALNPMAPQYYLNDTGVGNMLDLSNPEVSKLAISSLEYYADTFNVDGFRFDLAYALGRDKEHGYAYNPMAFFFQELKSHPVLKQLKLTGEPWDIGPGDRKTGWLPKGIIEWNDEFPKLLKKFWLKGVSIAPMARILAGCYPIFRRKGEEFAGLNYANSHDGQSTADNFTYEDRHNEENGEKNRDGSPIIACNGGAEGPTDDPVISRYRLRMAFNQIASLFVSFGPTMYKAGDEAGHTQRGNNNPYCQDGPINWLTWQWLFSNNQGREDCHQVFTNEQKRKILAFTQVCLSLRKSIAVYRNPYYPHGEDLEGITPEPGQKLPLLDDHKLTDLTWWNANGDRMNGEHWRENAHSFGMLLNNSAMPEEIKTAIEPELSSITKDSRILVVFNAHSASVDFNLPVVNGGEGPWKEIINTCRFSYPLNNETDISEIASGFDPYSNALNDRVRPCPVVKVEADTKGPRSVEGEPGKRMMIPAQSVVVFVQDIKDISPEPG